jgi:3-deoxy-D-manno-octulosonate 8-phosphate phosphatase (KDO 8-P phosphatase)
MGNGMQDGFAIRALVTDVDGVQTDGGMYFGPEGQVLKRFNVKDGYGTVALLRAGVLVAWITADDTEIVRERARRLGITELHSGVADKGACLRDLRERHGLRRAEVAYMGDDLNDLPAMAEAGLGACPRDAVAEVAAEAAYVSTRKGGEGAVRELCDLILRHNARVAGGGEG